MRFEPYEKEVSSVWIERRVTYIWRVGTTLDLHAKSMFREPDQSVSYTHLRAHETDSYLVCRLLLEKKKYAVFCLKKKNSFFFFFFLMIRRQPRSTHCISSAASDVYKRQASALVCLPALLARLPAIKRWSINSMTPAGQRLGYLQDKFDWMTQCSTRWNSC